MTTGPDRTNPKLLLGELWRGLCERKGLGRRHIEEALDCSDRKAARILDGEVGVKAADVVKLLDLFEATSEERARAEELARASQRRQPKEPGGSVVPPRWQRLYKLEPSASEIWNYSTEIVPGLTQTEDYAREIFGASQRDENLRERLVAQRVARSKRVIVPGGPRLSFLIGEGALRWVVGGPKVMAAQLDHLVSLSELDQVTIRVMPFSAGAHPIMGYSFSVLLEPSGLKGRTFAYHENLADSTIHDEDDRVAPYVAGFADALDRALSPDKSAALIATVVAGLRQR